MTPASPSGPPWPRLYLSPPHIGALEQDLVADAFASNWVAPLGPHVDAFESEFAAAVGAAHAVALSSGTAALHLALLEAGVVPGDEVAVSTLTFGATAFAVCYLKATPLFVDSEPSSWNMDPGLLAELLDLRARRGKRPRAVVLVHLYGQCADTDAVRHACDRHGVTLIEDAAEALGARYKGRGPGTDGHSGIFSFNGNKIITTSGGGMLVTGDAAIAAHVRKLATQARDPAPHYEHTEIGYNYRMSNVLAAIGRGQLAVLEARVVARRRTFQRYTELLGDLPGIRFMPEATFGNPASRATRWLTCLTIDPGAFGATREDVRLALEVENVESRPIWKPMHLQPVFAAAPRVGGSFSEAVFRDGLCLPSGSAMCDADVARVAELVRRVHERCARS
jgi:dTDP-4-amino-4,6-dideoxygalactose transaminase